MRPNSTVLLALAIAGCSASPPENLGLRDGQLTACPDSPNCVSSQSEDDRHKIAPLEYSTSLAKAKSRLKEIVQSYKRAKIVEETEIYLHAEFKIALLGFIDDVEFYLDEQNSVIHVRSASRTGHWDLGVNRRRIENIRKKWQNIET